MLLNYFLEVTLCWSIFYGVYYFLLRQETFFKLNRVYLLLTLLLGLGLPLLEFPTPIAAITPQVWLPEVIIGMDNIAMNQSISIQKEQSSISFLALSYGLGALFTLAQFLIGVYQIRQYLQAGKTEYRKDYKIIHLPSITAPFSFLNFLFLNKDLIEDSAELEQIIQHEAAHIIQKHSYDILLVELLKIFFWCCPLIYFYKKSLRTVHEYLADEQVLQTVSSRRQYGQFLLRHLQPMPTYSFVNHFHSQIKSRIIMMTKTPSSTTAQFKYLLILPAFILLALFTSCEKEPTEFNAGVLQQQLTKNIQENDGKISAAMEADLEMLKEKYPDAVAQIEAIKKRATERPIVMEGDIYKTAEEMPRFPGCEAEALEDERKSCADNKMLMFVYQNIKYPEIARKEGIEGTVVLKFIVDESGRAHTPEIVRSVEKSLDQEVLHVFDKMASEIIWIPGRQDGKAVNVQFHLPVKFKLA